MLLDPKKKDAMSIVASMAPKGMEEDDQDDSMMGLESAMEEFHDALTKRDYVRAATIFKSASQMCDDDSEYEEKDDAAGDDYGPSMKPGLR